MPALVKSQVWLLTYIDIDVNILLYFTERKPFSRHGALFKLISCSCGLNLQSNVFFANVGSQAEAWRYNSTFDWVRHGAIAAWLR